MTGRGGDNSAEKKFDIILCGVGGQGILSVAAVIARAAMEAGLDVRQSEVHGMAQRGGAVQAHLRISDREIHGDLIGRGRADMILSMEPLETLRYLEFLKPGALVVSACEPFNNIPDYPELSQVLGALKKLGRSRVVETKKLASQAGHVRSANMVLIGAAASELPFGVVFIQKAVRQRFSSKGDEVVTMNLRALELGAETTSPNRTSPTLAQSGNTKGGDLTDPSWTKDGDRTDSGDQPGEGARPGGSEG